MTLYLAIKAFHVLAAVVLVGAGIGCAFFLHFASRADAAGRLREDAGARALACRVAFLADLGLALPAGIATPASGFVLLKIGHWPFDAPWVAASLALYALATCLALPAFVLHARLAKAAAAGRASDEAWRRDARAWGRLALPLFAALAAIIVLMTAKP